MKVLLVGGASPLGSYLGIELVSNRHVHQVYDLKYNQNVKNKKLLSQVSKGVDVIVNMASVVLGKCFTSPQKEVDACVTGTINCIQICNERRIPFIYISTSEVYGKTQVPMKETTPCNPTTPYGAIKRCGEIITEAMSNDYLIIRPFNFFGPFMREDKYATIITKVVLGLIKNKSVPIYGDSLTNTRDWTYIVEMARKVCLAISKREQLKPIVNLGSGSEYSVQDVIATLEQIANKQIKLSYKPGRPGDIKRMVSDCSKFNDVTGNIGEPVMYDELFKYYDWRKQLEEAKLWRSRPH